MRVLECCVLLPLLLDLSVAQPHRRPQHRPHGKRVLEEVIDIELEVWTTVTLDGPAPSGWRHTDHGYEKEWTLSRWFTSVPDIASLPTTTINPKVSQTSTKDAKKTPATKQVVPSFHHSDMGTSSTSKVSPTYNHQSSLSTSKASSTAEGKPLSSTTEGSATISTSVASSSATSQTTTVPKVTGKYPFSALVAFGDNLSDNGNGSYAHHVADRDNPENTIYGARTWTNAQVAVSFLTDLLEVPMNQNFAFGHAWGGSDAGATLDNTMYVSDFHNSTVAAQLGSPGAPPASQQVSTYISQGVNKDALHFLWIGNNDADMVGFYQQEAFNKNLTTGMTKVVSQLLDAGAPYVLVPNIYPKQIAPVVPKYYGWTTPSQQDAFGKFITDANSALKAALASIPNSDKVIYYDANAFLTSVWNNAASYGLTNAKDTNGWPAFCDGDPDQTSGVQAAIAGGTINSKDKNNWGVCVDGHQQDTWFWMQYLDMTSRVHELLAGDMSKAIAAHFA